MPPDLICSEGVSQLGIAPPFILSVCSLEPRKNLDGLLRAFAALVQREGIPHQLVLVGQPKWRSGRLWEQVEALELEGRVCFTGYISDELLVQLFNQAAVFVYPSKYEGFGLPILEAMACAVPVVTSTGGALAEVAANAAILVDPESETALAEAMLKGLRDRVLRQRLVRAGLERAQLFSWQQMTRRICQFISNPRTMGEGSG